MDLNSKGIIAPMSAWMLAVVLLGAGLDSLALTIDAVGARIKSVGTVGQGGWNLFSNGEVGDYVMFPANAQYQVRIRASGSPCEGVWPEMALLLDNEPMRQTCVSNREPRWHTFSVDIKAGARKVSVSFLNDFLRGSEDRNLFVYQIELLPSGDQEFPALTIASMEQVAAEGQSQEDRVLAECDAAIEKVRKRSAVLRVIDSQGKPVVGAKVSIELVRHHFLFGCNIFSFDQFPTVAENDLYRRRFAELFNYATVGFYWRSYEPEPGKPRYSYTDKVLDWCSYNGIQVKGHPLLWVEEAGIPTWSPGQPSPERQRARVSEIVKRFEGKIGFWEVVNEPAHLPGLKIDEPYRWARAANPAAVLIVNDYEVMANGYPPFYELLQGAIARGVPFDGIGIQAHEPRTMRFPLERVRRTLDQYGALGKTLHITEFTPTSGGQPITGSHITGLWDEAAQADYAVKFYRVCFAHPKVVALTWWDLCDRHSWLKGGGMLRENLTPKPVYEALQKLIREQWSTRSSGVTDAAGNIHIRGFHGQYTAQIEAGAQVSKAPFRLLPEGGKEIVISVR